MRINAEYAALAPPWKPPSWPHWLSWSLCWPSAGAVGEVLEPAGAHPLPAPSP